MAELPVSRTPQGITVVVGMHRSGTSLCTNILSLFGLDMADDIGRGAGNEHGHWERWEVVGFHDRVLRMFDRDYYTHRHAEVLPDGWWAEPAVRKIRDELIAWVKERMGEGLQFGFKDPRTARLLPLWNEIFRKTGWVSRFVFCVRDPDQAMRSFVDRDSVHIGYLDPEYRWLVYNAAAVRGIGYAPVCIVPYEGWFSDFRSNVERLHRFVMGADTMLNVEVLRAAAGVVDESARHDRPVSTRAGLATRSLYDAILASMPHEQFSERAIDLASQIGAVEPLMSSLHDRAVAAHELETTLRSETAQHAAMQEVFERDLEAERSRAAAINAQLIEARSRAAEVESRIVGVESRVETAESRAASAESRAATAESRARDAEARLRELEQELDEALSEVMKAHASAAAASGSESGTSEAEAEDFGTDERPHREDEGEGEGRAEEDGKGAHQTVAA
jgi:hypothetical protein